MKKKEWGAPYVCVSLGLFVDLELVCIVEKELGGVVVTVAKERETN